MGVMELATRGGVMIWPIFVCLFIALGVMIDRIAAFRRVEPERVAFFARMKILVRRGDMNGVLALCAERNTNLATMVRDAVSRREEGEGRIRELMEVAGRTEAFRLEQRLSLLSLTAAIAPMLGFLGTMIGIIVALRAVELHSVATGSALLASRLWSAMLPSAFGLSVGISTLALHTYLVSRVRKAVHDLEIAKQDILGLLRQPVKPAAIRMDQHHEKATKRIFPYEEDEFFRKKTEAGGR